MGFAINTNNDALNTYRNLTSVQNSLSKSLEKLSSGLRINQAGDDAAGLTISTQLALAGLGSAAGFAERPGRHLARPDGGRRAHAGAVDPRPAPRPRGPGGERLEQHGRPHGDHARRPTSLTEELTRIGQLVNFNGQNLLDGTTPTFKFQVGADGNSQSQISVDLSGANLSNVANLLSQRFDRYLSSTITQGKAVGSFTTGSGLTFAVPSALGTCLAAIDDRSTSRPPC